MIDPGLPAGEELERLLETAESAMYADLYAAVPDSIARAHGLSCDRRGAEVRFTVAAVDHPFFNRVMGIGLDAGAPSEEWIADHANHYRAAGVRRYMLQVLPHAESDGLRSQFAAQGLVPLRGWAKHAGPVVGDARVESNLRVEAIDARHACDWSAICAEAFSFPASLEPWLRALVGRQDWHLYLAFDQDEPIACAALHAHGDVATLTFAATRPAARRRGAQSALIAQRLRDAAALGCSWVQSETDEPLPERPNPSTNNVVRFGLPVLYVRANWGPPKPVTG